MTGKRLIIIGSLLALLVAGVLVYVYRTQLMALLFNPTDSSIEQRDVSDADFQNRATDLDTPWSISFLPGGDMLVSERNGQLNRIGDSGAVYPIDNVRETSEGGLLGIALHPDFDSNQKIYLYYTTDTDGQLTNQVDQARLADDQLTNQTVIVDGIPAASNHNGGAIAFGPDGKLYVTTGDAAQSQLAQDRQSLAGKILRINDDGSTPADNPFDNLVWSYGHRNPQGIAWDDSGQLWSVEHGPSGIESGQDELNKIDKGANYGWPEITGDESRDGMTSPVLQSGESETWAPARLAFADGSLYFTGLRGQSVYRVDIGNDSPTISRYFSQQYGRLRAITADNDWLYIGTSNRDGRGSPQADDDKIISIPLAVFDNN